MEGSAARPSFAAISCGPPRDAADEDARAPTRPSRAGCNFFAALLFLALGATPALGEDMTYCREAVEAGQAGESGRAIELASECIETGDLQPASLARAHFFRASILHQLQALDQAIDDYNTALRLDPDYEDAYFQRGSFFFMIGDFMKALPDYTEVLRLDPQNGEAYVLRGIAAHQMRDHARAIEDFNAALRINPEDREALFARSRAYEALGETERAATDRKASGF